MKDTAPLRILHTADLHIGRTLYQRSLREDQAYILKQIVSVAIERKVDLAIIAGDLFDRSVPSAEAVELADAFLSSLVLDAGIPAVIIAGNHDSPERLDFVSHLLVRQGLYIVGRLSIPIKPLVLYRGGIKFAIDAVPYAEPGLVGSLLNAEDVRDHEHAWKLIAAHLSSPRGKAEVSIGQSLDRIAAENRDTAESKQTEKQRVKDSDREFRILVGHCYVAGGGSSESERPLSIGGSELVDSSVFTGYDLVMLGHLHRPQTIAGKIRYSGSPLAYSATEAGYEKRVLVYDIDPSMLASPLWEEQAVRVDQIVLQPLRRLTILENDFETLSSLRSDDYIVARLTDTLPVFDAFSRLHKSFPFLLHVERTATNIETENKSGTEERRAALEAGDLQLVTAFIKDMTGSPPDEAQYGIITRLLDRAEKERRHGNATAEA